MLLICRTILVAALISVVAACSEEESPPSPVCTKGKTVYGLTLEPYNVQGTAPGDSITRLELQRRIDPIQSCVTWLRTFAVDGGLEYTGSVAHQFGLKVALGAYISRDEVENQRQINILIGLAAAGEADLLILGSETIQSGERNAQQLVAYIDQIKAVVPGLPVATVEPLEVYQTNPTLRDAVDAVLVSYYPFYEGRSIVEAVAGFDAFLQQAQTVAGAKSLVIAETGWPSAGEASGLAEANSANAAAYFTEFVTWANSRQLEYFYFTAFDQPWKLATGETRNAYFGVWDQYGALKPGMEAIIH